MKARGGASRATALVAFAVLVLPRLAEACPMCAGQQSGGVARVVVLGGMLLLPFSIAFVVFRALRRAGGLTTEEASTVRANPGAGSDHAGGTRELSL